MAEERKDHWHSGEYQHSAAFVPKLAGKVTEWLDLQKDDVVLDIGCGDGVLNLEFAKVLSQGKGSIHGIDSSAAMISAAKELCKEYPNATFEVLDATELHRTPALQAGSFTKIFSNAALHWVLRDPPDRAPLLRALHAALAPGGRLAFEMGGLGNVKEMAGALLLACRRRAATPVVYPWFFPDEAWAEAALAEAGFRVERVEREWRPTRAGDGGVEGWLRLFGKGMLESVPEGEEREAAVREAAEALRVVCDDGRGGEMISYVRLRALAIKE
ncbi:methyltransferase [Cordyceps fumosorosea ARSEF 2679]|uniref:Methyltransferase n=1 Tax=Cordyceps fumosorosea (strain ARSEF 2679) TaxID=1081104 RepID=A0A162LPR2_CORFA|nr:methyltransferase [Cordyceps fumosorosea ARSEF 2679]OAA73854.1 methyltransferase [Cordyceps fumosorosea ARSEF 2679]